MDGYVGWYRRDFTLPASAFPRYVPRAAQDWVVRFESVLRRDRVLQRAAGRVARERRPAV